MNRTLLAAGVLVATSLAAQEPARSADSATTQFDVAGIKVIHRPAGGDMVVANLYLLGGVRQVTWQTAGLEPFLLDATERGTKAYPKERLRRAMARLGTGISIGAEKDWTSFGIRATRSTFDSTWAIFASRITEPTFDAAEVELVRQQFLLAVSQRQDSPDALAEYLADSLAYDGHPYAVPETGTEASLARISVADLRAYHAAQFVKSRMLLVVVGNVTRDRITRMVTQSLGSCQRARTRGRCLTLCPGAKPRPTDCSATCPPTTSSDGMQDRPPGARTTMPCASRRPCCPGSCLEKSARVATSPMPSKPRSSIGP
jgi:zinc protease